MYIFSNISSVAKYESKLLKRSWFYRIFLILAVLFFFFFNFAALVNQDSTGLWIMRALASNIPYLNLLFLNTGQAIIAVFLSSEFLKADKKLDTSEVFYVHPISNAEYVFGKILGNLNVFIQLNLIVMALVAVLNFAADTQVDWLAYATYFLVISVPTLIYIFGLSIGIMLIIKNQAITFVVLLGYIALTLFYIGDKFYYLFDYMAYSLPLVKSSVVGFTNWTVLINHRLMYVLIGLGFICISVFLFRRLPNTKYGRYRWLALSFCFIIGGLAAGYNHVNTFLHASKMRTLYTEINNKYVNSPQMVIESYDISVEQHPKTISATAVMHGAAEETSSIFTFCLNPSLRISVITENGNDLAFTREHQIILVDFGRVLKKGDTTTFTISYSGNIDENFCYLDIPTELLEEKFVVDNFFNVDKRYSFQTEYYVLFTPETYWYPRPGVAFSSENPDWQKAYFSDYRLEIKTINGLQALSQGTDVGDGAFIFETDFPTPGISLIIGDYEQKSMEVDSTIYNIWHLKGNDFFTAVFDSIADTIPSQIIARRHAIESQYSLNYSFRRFSIVEAPVQFSSYVRAWTQAQEMMQPEMILFPEKAAIFNNADFTRQVRNRMRWARRQGREMTESGAILLVLNNFLTLFQNTETRADYSRERGEVNVTSKPNPYFIFPQLYNFRYNIYSSEWTIANRLIELYLQELADNPWMRQMNGISNNEKANLLIRQRPFKELLSDPLHRDLLGNIISLKANVLFAPAERNTGNTEFRDALRAFLNDNEFTNISFVRLLEAMSLISDEDLIAPLATWDLPTRLPAYIVGTPQVTNIVNRDVEVFVVKLQITNDSDYDGIINVETLFGGGSGASDDPRAKRKISLAARETKLIVTVWDEAPRAINVNTLISANLPNLINMPLNNITRERNRTIDVEGDFLLAGVSLNLPGEVIVNNEDTELFELSKPDNVGLLPRWLDRNDDDTFPYSGIQNWRPPLQWTLTTNDKYFGTHVRSAYVIRSGNGSQTATWRVPVPLQGLYDLYYHVFPPEELFMVQNVRGSGDRGATGGAMEYHFTVKYDDGEDNAYIDLRRADEGWNRVGTYYFSDDTIKVVLSNKVANVRMVTADAVKIVRRE